MNQNALRGIRILDFTWFLAGPYATRILADFGAEVIKVQSHRIASSTESNTTIYFHSWNRNKLGITLNMAHPKGRELALKLVKISDVVIENFTPRVMANWGMDYETLKETKPDLIMASISGMGQTGPWRDFAALGPTIQALSGLTYLTSYDQVTPVGIGYAYADIIAGLFAAFAVLMALEYKNMTGQGQYIDISEYEAMCSLLGPAILNYSINHNLITPQGNATEYIPAAPYGCYKCQGDDSWCVIAVFTEEEWHALRQALGNPSWARQERFSSLTKRKEHTAALNELLSQWTVNFTPDQVMARLQQARVPCGVVNTAQDLANDLQLNSRGFFTQAPHPVLGSANLDTTPIRLNRTPARLWRAAPLLGQDNRYVYQKLLGLSERQLRQYVERGIIV